MKRAAKLIIPGALAITGITGLGALGASVSADSTATGTTGSSTSATATTDKPGTPPADGNGPQQKDGGVIVTDETVISSVTDGVKTKYASATIDRVAKLPDGSYLAFTQTDGNKTIVSLDSSFAITDSKDVPASAPADNGQAPDQSTSN